MLCPVFGHKPTVLGHIAQHMDCWLLEWHILSWRCLVYFAMQILCRNRKHSILSISDVSHEQTIGGSKQDLDFCPSCYPLCPAHLPIKLNKCREKLFFRASVCAGYTTLEVRHSWATVWTSFAAEIAQLSKIIIELVVKEKNDHKWKMYWLDY